MYRINDQFIHFMAFIVIFHSLRTYKLQIATSLMAYVCKTASGSK